MFIAFNMQIMPTYESVLGYNSEIEDIWEIQYVIHVTSAAATIE